MSGTLTPKLNATVTVPACMRCADTTGAAHVHLPTYALIRLNPDGSALVRVPSAYLTETGAIDVPFLEASYPEFLARVAPTYLEGMRRIDLP